MRIKAGVAGTGSMGRNHARCFSRIEECELVAIFDLDPERAAAVAEEFGGKPVSSLEEFASLIDCASVAVPTVAHREVGTKLMDLGVHVLMEKPIANNLDDARALIETSQEKERVLQIGHIERFNPVMRELEARLDNPKFIEAHRLSPFPNRSMDIGVVLDVMIHDLEIILHLVNSPIKSIDAVGVPVLTHREDIANARLRFENGCVANITASRISPEKMRKLRVFQGDCYLSLDYQNQTGEMYWKEGMGIKRDEVKVDQGEPLMLELASFIACVNKGHSPQVTGTQGAAALDVALEITNQIAKTI